MTEFKKLSDEEYNRLSTKEQQKYLISERLSEKEQYSPEHIMGLDEMIYPEPEPVVRGLPQNHKAESFQRLTFDQVLQLTYEEKQEYLKQLKENA